MAPEFLEANFPNSSALSARVSEALNLRLSSARDYTSTEIQEVEELDKALFPKNFEISEEARETVRVLCSLSCCELRPAREIRSHRKFVGPLIVFVKRLTWPLVRFHLKDTFEAAQLFNSRLVSSHARQIYKLESLEQRLSSNTDTENV